MSFQAFHLKIVATCLGLLAAGVGVALAHPVFLVLWLPASSWVLWKICRAATRSFENLAQLTEEEAQKSKNIERLRQEFVANVTHELRTPLTAIQGFAETLLAGALDDKRHNREFVEEIGQHAQSLKKLIDDLLILSSIESREAPLDFQPVQLNSVLQKVLTTLRHQAIPRQVALHTVIPDGLPPVVADPDRLGQVFLNLVENAIKFNNSGGRVEIEASENGSHILVSIKDTGIGIPVEDLPRIFERFYRVDKARSRELGGTGLGLAIAKHIVEAHQGHIEVESELHKGSTFRFALPKVQA